MAYTLEAWCDEYETIRHHASRLDSVSFTMRRGKPVGVDDDVDDFASLMLAEGYDLRLGDDCRDKNGRVRKSVEPALEWLDAHRAAMVDALIEFGDACPKCRRVRKLYEWEYCPFCGTKYTY